MRLGGWSLLALLVGALVLRAGFALGGAAPLRLDRPALAVADTDTVRAPRLRISPESARPDTAARTLPDSLAADSLRGDTLRAPFYAPRVRERPYARLTRRTPFLVPLGASWRTEVRLDSADLRYTLRERVGGVDVRVPRELTLDEYLGLRQTAALDKTYRDLLAQRARQTAQRRGGLGVSIVVPGGRQSAFSTIFGKNEVSLRVSGQADINAGLEYRYSERQQAITATGGQIDPAFQQDLRLGVIGTIGDKMRINVDWDTRNQFDYQNQVSLKYTGYEDEIVRSVEAGNVLLQTPSSLIRGGQSLFGIKSEFQLGGLKLTTVASQQKGQGSNLNITGGAEEQTFTIKSSEYDDGRHYFLGYYFRNAWDTAHAQPPQTLIFDAGDDGRPGVREIVEIEVWRFSPTLNANEQFRKAVAVVDLGEEAAVTSQRPEAPYRRRVAPDPSKDRYDDASISANVRRRTNDTLSSDRYLQSLGLRDYDFQTGSFKLLVRERDYFIDPQFGFLSLNQQLSDNEALAVAYRYRDANDNVVQVGDFAANGTVGAGSDNALFLKLLRRRTPQAPSQTELPAAWPLEMRNVYSLRSRGLDPQNFNLTVEYEPPGSAPSQQLPVASTGARTLLTVTGLDRVGSNGNRGADNRFDYLPGFTIDENRGLIFFPYVEPFGQRIASVVGDVPQAGALVYRDLYLQKKEEARRNTLTDVYRIRGKYQGAVQSFFDLRAFSGLINGSVRVRSGGVPLQENSDYLVDYTAGTVTITNPAFLTAGRNIEIDYEQNQLFALQQKTLLGVRADYDFGPKLQLGATLMRLTQRSPLDKFRVGDEPVQNVIWGLDGRYVSEQPWLTRLIDRLPLVQTRAPSRLNVQAEFAQLRPGNPQTVAFRQERGRLQDDGLDFFEDELRGISFIDDFESFENAYSLKQASTWSLSAAPDSIPAVDFAGRSTSSFSDSLRTTFRGGFAWYTLTREVGDPSTSDPAVRFVKQSDVYDIDLSGLDPSQQLLTTFDTYFTPRFRGPYNFNRNLADFFANPKRAWGGMITRIPETYTDFGLKNVEFLEFVVRPLSEAPGGDAGEDAYLFVDLGRVSEDILPDGRDNTEDGLSLESVTAASLTPWGRTPTSVPDRTVALDETTERTEDLGIDGLVSYNTAPYDPAFLEANRFRTFVNSLPEGATGNPVLDGEIERSRVDPSGDDYHHYLDNNYFGDGKTRTPFFPNGAKIQERFLRFFPASELNSFEGQNKLDLNSSTPRGNSTQPDTEDLNQSGNTNRENVYLQYRIPLSLSALRALSAPESVNDFVVGETKEGSGYYLVRIPVRQPTRCVGVACSPGEVQSFLSNVESIRVWTTGHQEPITMRYADFDLVSSQWQKSTRLTTERVAADPFGADTRFSISSFNTEENPSIYASPNGTVTNQRRSATGGRSGSDREQTLVLRTENLRGGRQRAIYKTFTTALDLLKYEHVRLFTHLDAKDAQGRALTAQDRGRAAVFVRLGSNEGQDYFEYEQPLTPSEVTLGSPNPISLWPDDNSANILLSALNQLKAERDNRLTAADADQRSRLTETFFNVGPDGQVRSGAPNAETFAPPGTRVGIRGQPTLNKVTTIVIGLRSLEDSTSTSTLFTEANLWVNELRVTGYDETNGWSALGNVDLALADLGTVRASLQTQTDGFGALGSTLGERDQNSILTYSINAQVNADKLLPAQSGWSVPVNVALQQRTNTPRFAPNRGGIPLADVLAGIDARTVNVDGTPLEDRDREALRQNELEAAQDYATTRSLSVQVSKRGSKSIWLQRTLDALQASYSTASASARNPSTLFNDTWNWTGGVGYQLASLPAKTVRPLWFLDALPVVKLLSGLRFNYVPTTLGADAQATRNFASARDRKPLIEAPTAVRPLPDLVRFPFREQHAFSHGRTFTLGYSPFSFLTTQFDSRVAQNLGLVGVDTLFSLVRRSDGSAFSVSRDEAILADTDTSVFVQSRLDPLSTGRTLGRIFAGDDRFRTDTYGQNFTATLRLQLPRALDFLRFERASYNAQYSWQNAPLGQAVGASVTSQVQFNADASLAPQTLFRKFGFFRGLERAQEQADNRARAEREAREALRQAEREERRRERRERADLERRARELGVPVDSLLRDSTRTAPLPTLPSTEPTPVVTPAPEPPPAGGDVPDKVALRAQVEAESAPTTAPTDSTAADSTRRRRWSLPLPSPATLLRRTVLTLGGIQNVRLSYTGAFQSSNAGVDAGGDSTGTPYSFIDAVRGQGPNLGYRFGLERRLPIADRLLRRDLQLSDVLADNHTLNATTDLTPTPNLRVALSWQASLQQQETYSLRQNDDRLEETLRAQGSTRAYVWAFGANFGSFFDAQFNTLRNDVNAAGAADTLRDADGNGRIALTPQSLAQDFRAAFTRMPFGTFDGPGFLPIPLPSFQITYTGASKWPLLRSIASSVSLRSSYNAEYGVPGFSKTSLPQRGFYPLEIDGLEASSVAYLEGRDKPQSLNVNERYAPLIGASVSFKNSMTTEFNVNKANTYGLNLSDNSVAETHNDELSLAVNYARQGLRIPFVRNRLNNRITFSLQVQRSVSSQVQYRIQNALVASVNQERATGTPLTLDEVRGADYTTRANDFVRLTVSPSIGYQFSNAVQGNFTFRLEQFSSQVSTQPDYLNMSGLFNIRVNITSY